ncbi:Transcription factor Sp1 [Orchesella cincta]|uniref:Transcription factor Sp1 n=1 Tax=Orchesella cincta TaxID=48709 RepID=A0A1D2N8S6_ORCCI|nr:Transcription factor Sp1 [Orchesella cincta]
MNICGKEFTRKDNLTRHLKLAHSRESKPRCKYCLKSLSRKDAVQRHETTCSKNYGKPGDVSKLSHLQRLNMKLEKSKCSSGENPNKVDQTEF